MDILDIDEALKDDSFMFLEEKTHDDVSNILQQWKSQNDLLKANKFDSKTFTRCKKKPSHDTQDPQNLTFDMTQYSSLPKYNFGAFVYGDPQNFQLEVNGLASSMHKSFLQDTSPPLSICSSIDKSIDIQHATLLHYPQNVMDDEPSNDDTYTANSFTSNGNIANNILHKQEMDVMAHISRDEAQFKDSQIGQFDEISLALSKTESNCSTMNNSIENMVEILKQDGAIHNMPVDSILDKEMIINTSLNLVENSLYESAQIQEWVTPEDKRNDCPIYKSTPFVRKSAKQIFCGVSISPIGPKDSEQPIVTTPCNETIQKPSLLDTLKKDSSYTDLSIKLNDDENMPLNSNILLDKSNEEEFEHFLDELSKVKLSSKQQRLKTSVDVIKNHFKQNTCGNAKNESYINRDNKDLNEMTFSCNNTTSETLRTNKRSNHEIISPSFTLNDGERLLSRRSRLYDDESISPEFAVQTKSTNYTSIGSMPYKESDSNNTGASIMKNEQNSEIVVNNVTNATATTDVISTLYDKRKHDQNFYSAAKERKLPTMKKCDERYGLNTQTYLKQKEVLTNDNTNTTNAEKRSIAPNASHIASNNLNQHTKYLTFVKPKHKDVQQIRQPFAPSIDLTQTYIATSRSDPLTEPSLSATNLNTDSAISSESEDYHQHHFQATKCNSVQSVVSNEEQSYDPELKSPLYTKAKSFHNLTSNIDMDMEDNKATNAVSDISLIPTTSALRKPNYTFLANKQQNNPHQGSSKPHEFKIPKALPPMRAIKSSNDVGESKRSFVARPSSGYYSLNSNTNVKANRSASKDSSRDTCTNVPTNPTDALKQQDRDSTPNGAGSKISSMPSGIRPPTIFKRSALPRPSSLVRR